MMTRREGYSFVEGGNLLDLTRVSSWRDISI